MHFVRFDLASRDWMAELGQMPGRLVCLSPPWLQFLAESQRGTPVAAVLMDQDRSVGVFAGMIVNRGGIRILGSPFPGWTTPYMGLDLLDGVSRREAYGWGFASYRDARDQHPNEFMMFHAMNEWRRRGFKILDLGGSGSYKEKYHPRPTPIPWVRVSRYPFVPPLRELARVSVMARQRIRGRLASSGSRAPLPLDGGTP